MEPTYHFVRGIGWLPAVRDIDDRNDRNYLMGGSSPECFWYLQGMSGWVPVTSVEYIPDGIYKLEVWLPIHNRHEVWVENSAGERYDRSHAVCEIQRFVRDVRDYPEWRLRLVKVD